MRWDVNLLKELSISCVNQCISANMEYDDLIYISELVCRGNFYSLKLSDIRSNFTLFEGTAEHDNGFEELLKKAIEFAKNYHIY